MPARDAADLSGEAREASGQTTRLILAYVEREGGTAAVEDVLTRAGLAGCESELRDEHSWFADATRCRLFDMASEALDDPDAARRIGQAAIELNGGQATKLAVRALGSPKLIYSNVARVNARFNLVHRMDVLVLDDGYARIRNVPLPGVPWHPSDCGYNIGLLASAPSLFGQPPATRSPCGVHRIGRV